MARQTTCQEGETLHIIVGDDERCRVERNRLLKKGLTLTENGVEWWQTWEERHPTQWHDDGNRTRQDLVEYAKRNGDIHKRVVRSAWKKAQ